MEYIVIISAAKDNSSFNDFVDLVNVRLKQGWRPQGGIVVTGSNQLVQAMVRDHNNPEVTYDLLRN
jgi:hypothetical protein